MHRDKLRSHRRTETSLCPPRLPIAGWHPKVVWRGDVGLSARLMKRGGFVSYTGADKSMSTDEWESILSMLSDLCLDRGDETSPFRREWWSATVCSCRSGGQVGVWLVVSIAGVLLT